MIVTRQRRRPFPWKRLGLPLIAIALVSFALWWTPSRNVIANGPAAPLWHTAGNAFGVVATPFHFAAQNQLLTDRNKQIVQLQKQITDLQSQDQAKDKKIGNLQSQVGQMQTQAANANSVKSTPVQPAASAAPFGSTASGTSATTTATGGDLSAGATADMRRTAQYWGNMEPENAAKVVQKLPVVYVARVFAQMSPDSVSSILDALPANYVAELTQEHPELRR